MWNLAGRLLEHDRQNRPPLYTRNRNRSLRVESLETRCLLHGDLVISELLASNADGLLDFQDNDSDWFEIHNRGSSRVDLRDWYVTDDANLPTKWPIPVSAVIEPDERLVLFASGDGLVAPNGELHANYKLSSDGEFLALVDPGGTVIDSYDPSFPPQTTNISYGIDENIQITSLVGPGATATALVPSDATIGNNWTGANQPFDDANWVSGTTAIGYETNGVGGTIAPPIAYWTFDQLEHGGTVAPDERGRYDGTVVGATLTSGNSGRFGEAMSFGGDNDYVNVGAVDEFVNPSAMTISLWFRRAADHSGSAAETNHKVNNVLIGHSSTAANDTLEVGTENGFIEVYLDTDELGGSIAPTRQGRH